MPQTPPVEHDWQTRTKEAQVRGTAMAEETKAIQAEEAQLRAQKALEATKAALDPARVAQAEQQAQRQANIDSLKAAVGSVAASPIQGDVALGEKAGQMESALLSTRAMLGAASQVAQAVAGLPSVPEAILVVPHGEAPDLKALNGLRSFTALMSPALINASRSLESALSAREMPGREALAAAPAVAGVGLALEAASKLLGYFRTDYSIGGTESTADQLALAELVAGQLRAALPNTRIYLPSVYAGNEPAMLADFFNKELKPLAELHQAALDKLDRATTLLATSAPASQEPATEVGPAASQEQAQEPGPLPAPTIAPAQTVPAASASASAARDARIRAAADRLAALSATYQAAIDKLMAEGVMDTLLRQHALDAKLSAEKAVVLVTRLHKAGGSHYVMKNLWNLFGKMPFKVMGGAIASYSLFEGISGQLLQSATHAVHGGFKTANELS